MKEYHARPNDQDESVMTHHIGIETSVRTPQLKPRMASNLGRHAFLFLMAMMVMSACGRHDGGFIYRSIVDGF